MSRTKENFQLWEHRIKECAQSGMKVDEWCNQNGITKHQYYYWCQLIRKNKITDQEVTFVDITQSLSNPRNVCKEIRKSVFQVSINDLRVEVPNDFDKEALAELMKVLREV